MTAQHDSYLVTGGAGLLGRHIVDQLLKRGETAVAIFDLVAAEQDPQVRVFTGDITDRHAFETAVRAVSSLFSYHKMTTHALAVVWRDLHHSHRRRLPWYASRGSFQGQCRRYGKRHQRRHSVRRLQTRIYEQR